MKWIENSLQLTWHWRYNGSRTHSVALTQMQTQSLSVHSTIGIPRTHKNVDAFANADAQWERNFIWWKYPSNICYTNIVLAVSISIPLRYNWWFSLDHERSWILTSPAWASLWLLFKWALGLLSIISSLIGGYFSNETTEQFILPLLFLSNMMTATTMMAIRTKAATHITIISHSFKPAGAPLDSV